MAALRRRAVVKPTNYTPPPGPTTEPIRAEGIIHAAQSPFPTMQFMAWDGWQGLVAGRWVVAYAGSLTHLFESPPTGAVILFDEPVNLNAAKQYFNKIGTFPAPKGDIGLKVIGYRGDVLALETRAGTIVRFDVASHTYS